MPVGITYEGKVDSMKQSYSRSYNTMYVTTAGDAEHYEFNSTMNFIKNNFNLRDHTQKEFWLIGLETRDNTENKYNNEFFSLSMHCTVHLMIQVEKCLHGDKIGHQ